MLDDTMACDGVTHHKMNSGQTTPRAMRCKSALHTSTAECSKVRGCVTLTRNASSLGITCLLFASAAGSIGCSRFGPGVFEIVTGKLLNEAIPRDVYLEGSAIPVEKRNAVLIKTPGSARALFALIVTAGFASQLQQKYSGILISEGRLSICGKDAGIGSYGFGIRRPPLSGSRRSSFFTTKQAIRLSSVT
ncbi:MAG: hypothetical protein ACRD3T_10045 [Terriglobia bacterium]